MNDARRRRPEIRKRARFAKLRRIYQERLPRRRGEDVVMPAESELFVEGRIFLDYSDTYEGGALTSVWMETPARGFMKKLNDMQKFGFWAPRPQDRKMLHVPPGKIISAEISVKED